MTGRRVRVCARKGAWLQASVGSCTTMSSLCIRASAPPFLSLSVSVVVDCTVATRAVCLVCVERARQRALVDVDVESLFSVKFSWTAGKGYVRVGWCSISMGSRTTRRPRVCACCMCHIISSFPAASRRANWDTRKKGDGRPQAMVAMATEDPMKQRFSLFLFFCCIHGTRDMYT